MNNEHPLPNAYYAVLTLTSIEYRHRVKREDKAILNQIKYVLLV